MIHKKGKRRELPPLFLHFEQLYQKRKNGRDGDFRRPSHILHEHDCKPGSVFDSHLSTRRVAAALQPPRERPGKPIAPIPVLLRIEFTASDTLEPTGALLPHLSTFSHIATGSLFLLHFSSDRSGRALPVILALWSPDFPHSEPFGFAARLSVLLANLF